MVRRGICGWVMAGASGMPPVANRRLVGRRATGGMDRRSERLVVGGRRSALTRASGHAWKG